MECSSCYRRPVTTNSTVVRGKRVEERSKTQREPKSDGWHDISGALVVTGMRFDLKQRNTTRGVKDQGQPKRKVGLASIVQGVT